MISVTIAALGLQSSLAPTRIGSSRVSEPVMVSRRELFTTVAGAAVVTAMPLSAMATYENGQSKAKGIFGQKVLALVDASPEAILDNQAAIETYVSQMIRASGKRNVDGRRLGRKRARRLGASQPLGAGQIDEGELPEVGAVRQLRDHLVEEDKVRA